jgi:hypothetical protein
MNAVAERDEAEIQKNVVITKAQWKKILLK